MSDVTTTCAWCGARVNPTSAARTGDGFICARCEEHDIQDDLWKKASIKLLGGAASSIPLAAASYVFSPLASGMPVSSGSMLLRGTLMSLALLASVSAMVSATRHPEYRAAMGAKRQLVYALALVGLLITAGHFVLPFVLR